MPPPSATTTHLDSSLPQSQALRRVGGAVEGAVESTGPRLLGLGTATPAHRMSQEESLEMFVDIVCADERRARLARALYRKSGVENRHTCVPHQVAYRWCQRSDDQPFEFDQAQFETLLSRPDPLPPVVAGRSAGPTTQERMAMYRLFAPELSEQASRRALSAACILPRDITHLVTVSCTGFGAPGVDLELIQRLQLPASTQRVNVGFMGCHGAINGLRTALGIAASQPEARVLMCAVELCSLHYRFRWDDEGIVGNALFADGAGAVIITQPKTKAVDSSELASDGNGAPTQGAWQLLATGSCFIPDSQQTMSWEVGNHGFEMLLTSEVGDKIEASLAEWLDGWLEQQGLTRDDVDCWGVHPGGPRILDAVERSLELHSTALATSRNVLKQYGNMSSPTVLFILNEFTRQLDRESASAGKTSYALLLAFGPGLMAEVALLAR